MAKRRQLEANLDEPTRDLANVAIFRAGDYGEKGKYDRAFLEGVVATYDPKAHEAPVTLDHAQEGPAYGWISSLRADGDVLFADLKGVPEKLARAIEAGRYKKRSIEFYEVAEKLLVRAVSFLGAQVPHVKGLPDVAFGEEKSKGLRSVDWADARDFAPARSFAEIVDPDPGGHGVILTDCYSDHTLSHYHEVYVDAEGNGFTGPPRQYTVDCGWLVTEESDASHHIHIVKDGIVQAADKPTPHSHGLTTYSRKDGASTPSGESFQEPTTMSEKDKTKDTPPAPASDDKKFAELNAKIEALAADNKRLADEAAKAKAEHFAERESARFDKAFDEAHSEGRVTPAEREALKRAYLALPTDETKVSFNDEKGNKVERGFREDFLTSLKARPVVVPFGEMAATQARSMGAGNGVRSGGNSEKEEDDRDFEETTKLADEKGISFAEAASLRLNKKLSGV